MRKSAGGRIRGDDGIDYADQERRESLQTLKILALFVLALCTCLAIVWLLARDAA